MGSILSLAFIVRGKKPYITTIHLLLQVLLLDLVLAYRCSNSNIILGVGEPEMT